MTTSTETDIKAWNFEIHLGFLEGVEKERRAESIFCHKILGTLLN